MTWIDDIITELQKSPSITPENLQRISDFLRQHQAIIETLTDDAKQAFFTLLAGGDPAVAWTAIADSLTSAQLLALLRDTAGQVVDLTALRQKALAEFQSALAGVESFAIQLLAKAALALL